MVKKAQVYKIHSDFYYVNFEKKIYECKVREVLKKQKEKVLVGDFVEIDEINQIRRFSQMTVTVQRIPQQQIYRRLKITLPH